MGGSIAKYYVNAGAIIPDRIGVLRRTIFEMAGSFEATDKLSLTGSVGYAFIGDSTAVSGAVFEGNNALIFRTKAGVRF